jgi:hypothetical protein
MRLRAFDVKDAPDMIEAVTLLPFTPLMCDSSAYEPKRFTVASPAFTCSSPERRRSSTGRREYHG